MNCDNINKFIILGLILTIANDLFFLFVEIISQRCDKEAEKEKEEEDKKLRNELAELRKEILALKKRIYTPD